MCVCQSHNVAPKNVDFFGYSNRVFVLLTCVNFHRIFMISQSFTITRLPTGNIILQSLFAQMLFERLLNGMQMVCICFSCTAVNEWKMDGCVCVRARKKKVFRVSRRLKVSIGFYIVNTLVRFCMVLIFEWRAMAALDNFSLILFFLLRLRIVLQCVLGNATPCVSNCWQYFFFLTLNGYEYRIYGTIEEMKKKMCQTSNTHICVSHLKRRGRTRNPTDNNGTD